MEIAPENPEILKEKERQREEKRSFIENTARLLKEKKQREEEEEKLKKQNEEPMTKENLLVDKETGDTTNIDESNVDSNVEIVKNTGVPDEVTRK